MYHKSLKSRRSPTPWMVAGVVVVQALCLGTAQGLTINLNDIGGVGTGSMAEAGFQAAASIWENLFSDNVTVNLDVGFTTLGAGILGSTGSTQADYGWGATRTALINDQTSSDDTTATSNLPGVTPLELVINRTSDNPNGYGSATPYIDADNDTNNNYVRMTQANARALGLHAAVDGLTDASITFSTLFTWDFDTSNGVTGYDFVGVAAHEIGHALGFVSGVDLLDYNSSGFYYNDFNFLPSTLDLYRYSDLSFTAGGYNDMSADTRDKYFSIDGGTTDLASFSTGVNHGDGRQASHWKDTLGLGIMDPTAASGEHLMVSSLDTQAFDVIGWDLAAVPEPATLTLVGLGLAALAYRKRRAV